MRPKFDLSTEVLKVVRILLALAVIYLMTGCSEDNSEAAKIAIKQNLPVTYKVEYGEFTSYPGGVLCGDFTPIGRFDVPEKPAAFVFINGEVLSPPSEDDLAIFCSKDQEGQLRKRLGISNAGKGAQSLQAVRQHLGDLDQALQAYLSDNRIYPLTEQGLTALVTASEINPKPFRFRDGGYIDQIPDDPWGRPYHYSSEEVLRLEPIEYSLFTLGRDGEPGGEGEDADINSNHLKYLNHIFSK